MKIVIINFLIFFNIFLIGIILKNDNLYIERNKKVLGGVAFELDDRIVRCNDIISNEASVAKMKRGP